jgi:hypothetical protein
VSGAGVIGGAPAPARGQGLDHVVALALAAMCLVLGIVFVEQRRAPTTGLQEPFDWQNPMLSAQPGQCVDVATEGTPGSGARLVVRPEAVVLRPYASKEGIPGWKPNLKWPDPHVFPPYLLVEQTRAPGPQATGMPADKSEPLAFPLGWFGMPLESQVVLRSLGQSTVTWNGQTRRAYVAELYGYLDFEGSIRVYLSKDAPALGVMRREFAGRSEGLRERHAFRVPESCR